MLFSKGSILAFLLSEIPLAAKISDLAHAFNMAEDAAAKAEVVKAAVDLLAPYAAPFFGRREAIVDSEEGNITKQEQLLDALAKHAEASGAPVPRRDGRWIAAALQFMQLLMPLFAK